MLYYLLILLAVLLVWNIESRFQKWAKYGVYVAYCYLVPFLIPLWLFNPGDSANALLPARGFRIVCRLLGVKYSVEGKENVNPDSGGVVLINHQSILDLLVLSILWPTIPRCSTIAKKSLLYVVPIGFAIGLCGAIFIDREKSSQSHEAVNKTATQINKRQARVLIFPEGTRNGGLKLLPFKKGAFHLAIAAQCPIQPVAVSRFTFLGKNKFTSGEIKIKILPAISTKNLTTEDIPRLIDETYELMSKTVDEITQ
ncbi:1-acyl-sn-glycerol-3-phosphate acyltransferase beta [Diabrotica virgifera virgifera]|uniref:1-acyl-sn-glycerol-3-phosphate acyltransferase n=1 Tax=Diabrotica virgifera virgifera TaxID=50390 RepID=A0A6P7FDD8_DIAVI|nr:1-acyl-sn-glycerol-3-phosphate acyltransferase beta [Diabrotica virgifera virgifera]XP_050515545.1 1-acyl-sn-glycerol-3-phosphate acyltransferase beta [Diabrotica virgifera virgifera]XP_050515546.1 1-acyl-sn-glycerol-3-phosphate acyltransferase beta [Diabrotica virgifera virgifera]XP_050515547.1 1-acyl-sn-glycerol-3-phosphate acyltransferase beta [Diabrotica virgifera virgifera]XP_050515549.1 1-acyl-sn-glycerol-3-phosphate acyltransferase beta [Diabrotica virgifera virgifera]